MASAEKGGWCGCGCWFGGNPSGREGWRGGEERFIPPLGERVRVWVVFMFNVDVDVDVAEGWGEEVRARAAAALTVRRDSFRDLLAWSIRAASS